MITAIPRAEDAEHKTVLEVIERFTACAVTHEAVAFAGVIIRRDGATFVCTTAKSKRILLMGAIADLQYSLAQSGDT